jgi:hypothetical protein
MQRVRHVANLNHRRHADRIVTCASHVYPFTLYSDGFDFNDALVAATLVGALLLADSPSRRGVMAALAGWTKLSPLALVPVLMAHPAAAGERRWRTAAIFGVGFVATSMVVFLPAIDHGSLASFLSRSRQDLIGLAAVSAAVLVALQICDGYYSFSYLLWFVPLVLVALSCDSGAPGPLLERVRRQDVAACLSGLAIGPGSRTRAVQAPALRLREGRVGGAVVIGDPREDRPRV